MLSCQQDERRSLMANISLSEELRQACPAGDDGMVGKTCQSACRWQQRAEGVSWRQLAVFVMNYSCVASDFIWVVMFYDLTAIWEWENCVWRMQAHDHCG